MPQFMDVHNNLVGTTLAEIEQAHLNDVDAQERHGVRYLQFWHNPAQGQVFCLAEGPSAEACAAVHLEANGMMPDAIIPVERAVLEGFMGHGPVTPSGAVLDATGELDTGLRAIFFSDIVGSTRLTEQLGEEVGLRLVVEHDRILGEALDANGGRRIKHTGDGMMASFLTGAHAIRAAVAAQRGLAAFRAEPDALPLEVRMGIHAGEPVAQHGDLFGLAVVIASRICDAAGPSAILVSDLAQQDVDVEVPIEPVGPMVFKGLSTAVLVHTVEWRA